MKAKLQIRDVVKLTGLDRETLRFYEQKGLLQPAARTDSNYRQFEPDVVTRLKFIKAAQNVGFTLKEISELLSIGHQKSVTRSDLQKIARSKIKDIDHKIQSLKAMRTVLRNLEKRASTITKNSDCTILSQFKKLEL